MGKTKKRSMDLNKETAMRLWCATFGKETKAVDFSGREIAKGAYNDRNSEYGWNVDHILPVSKGGKTADYNLIVCSIKTNDEKADKFPAFNANGKRFEIIKVENHYEIRAVVKKNENNANNPEEGNLFDSAYGIRLYKDLKGIQNKHRFVGTVLVRFNNVYNTALIDFIEKIFDSENLSYSCGKGQGLFSYMQHNDWEETRLIIRDYDMESKEDTQNLLDKCVLLNTYLDYFHDIDVFDEYEIRFRLDYFENKKDMYRQSQDIDFREISGDFSHTLLINELVKINTDAKDKKLQVDGNDWYCYDYYYTKLADNLSKELKKGGK